MRVLIVDDDEHIRTGLQRSLLRLGYDVLVASNGVDGLKLATEGAPAVILVDIRMPGMDGHTFARRLKSLGLDPSIIVMSAHGEMDDVIDAVRAGAVDYLRKPWTPTDLSAAVARAADLYETRRQPAAAEAPTTATVTATAPAPEPPLPPPAPVGMELSFSWVLKRIQAGELLLPAVPFVLGELRALVRRPESRPEDVVALIGRDQKLSAQVIRLSNTFQHSRAAPSQDLKTAVGRVGPRRVQALAETVAANDLCPIEDPTLAALRAKIWTYSLARALAMRALAETLPRRPVDAETAYLAGLYADVGASFLLWTVAERTPVPSVADCTEFIRVNHNAVGNLVLTRWGVDREMTMLARMHHATSLPEPRDPYCVLEAVAASLAEQLAPDGDVTARTARSADLLRECNLSLGVSAVTQQSVLARLAPELTKVLEALV